MPIIKGPLAAVAALAAICAVTAILYYAKLFGFAPHHPIFFYLLPVALVGLLCGPRPALLAAFAATACAAFFLYDPMYSFYVTGRLAFGDLVCFAVLAAIGIKCADELVRPVAKIPAAKIPTAKIPTAKSRYGRP